MVAKTDLTTEEWNLLLGAPTLAAMAVTLADPSGLFGMLKEGMSSGRAVLAAMKDPHADALAQALAHDLATSEGRHAVSATLKANLAGKPPAEMKAEVLQSLGRVAALVDQRAPAEAAGFKTWLLHIAEQAAEASTEGGFLGFGGIRVSDAEKATLDDLRRTFGLG